MTDLRLQCMAQVLVQHSLGMKAGDRLAIRAETIAAPLIREVVREALRVGAHPELFVEISGVREILLKEGSDLHLSYVSDVSRLIAEKYEAILDIASRENTRDLSAVDPARIARQSQAQMGLLQTFLRRFNEGTLHRSLTLYPTNAYAQDANMSLSEFQDFFYHACFLDEDDPIARWRELSQQQERLIQWLKGRRTVHILGPETDLTFSIEGRTFLNDDARANFPGGEFFTTPVEHSTNGFIRYRLPASYGGRAVEDIYLRFEQGVVVEARAGQGQEYLEKMLNIDAGARRLGEFAFGNNRNINRHTQNTLFDEKMSKTIHLALGAGFATAGGQNQSALHWDMVYDLRPGSEVRIDGELFCRDGCFTL